MGVPVPPSESALKRLLASFGIGAARLELYAVGEQHPRGSTVEGTVTARGGQVTQRLTQLNIRLKSFAEGDPAAGKTLATEVLTRHVTLLPQEVIERPFQIRIPDDARLSRYAGVAVGATEGCVLVAQGLIEGGWRPRQARALLNVTPHQEIEAVLGALRWMGFVGESWFSHHFLRPDENEETTVVFRAPERLQEQLSALSIYLKATRTRVIGKILLELRPHSLGSHVKLLVGGNRQQHPLEIPCEALRSPTGQPNIYGAMPYVKQILSLALALPDDPKSWMLRASMSPPADPETLLRPAMPTPGVAGDQLLRPTAPPEKEA